MPDIIQFSIETVFDSRGLQAIAVGPTGKTAYEVAVDNGYAGTVEEWLAEQNEAVLAAELAGQSRDTAGGFATLAMHYAMDSADSDVPNGSPGDRGAKFHSLSAAAQATAANTARQRAQNAVPFLTWTALNATTGMTPGDRAQVAPADAGTHTDPVVGGTVNNSGLYQYSNSPAGWQRIANTDSAAAAASASTALTAQQAAGALGRYYSTRAAGAAALATGELFSSAETGTLAIYQRTGTAPNYTWFGDIQTAAGVDRVRAIQGEYLTGALRDFFKALDVFSNSEDGVIVIGSYGDSVSADVAMMFADQLARNGVGFMGQSSFSTQEIDNPLVTPTGTETGSRWTGTGLSPYVLAGGATYVINPDGPTPNPVYVPNADRHWLIPAGGSVTWTLGLTGTNFRRAIAFLVKEAGSGSATVELINAATDAVISTVNVGSLANATIAATHADFTALDTSLGYKVRVTASGGPIRALGVVGMFRRCIIRVHWRWGGSTLTQQCASSKAIFDYINNTLGTAIMFVETRGEDSAGVAALATRINALNCSKIVIGNRPTTGASKNAAADLAELALYREIARTWNWGFVDGYAILGGGDEMERLVWDRKNNVPDGVHLPLITAGYIAGYLFNLIPVGHLRNWWQGRKVHNDVVATAAYQMRATNTGFSRDATVNYMWAEDYGLGATTPVAKLTRIGSAQLRNPYGAQTATLSMYGTELSVDKGFDIASTTGLLINHVTLLRGQKSGWTIPSGTTQRSGYAAYAAGVTLTFGASYVQAEHTALATRLAAAEAGLQDVSRTLAALVTDLHNTTSGNLRLLGA